MVRHHALISAIVIGLGLFYAPTVSAQSSSQQIEPIIPPEWKPDLVVTSATATTVCTPQGTVTANIVATIVNQGKKATADLSYATWQIIAEARWWTQASASYLENPSQQTVKPQVGGPKTLAPGQSWTGTLTIVGIPKYKHVRGYTVAGNYVFEVSADPLKAVPEGNETNNKKMTVAPDACFKS